MEYIQLNQTALSVSPICLGTASFGSGVTGPAVDRQLDLFLSLGGNFIDSAHVYGDWMNQGPGLSERLIGQWLKERGGRDKLVISTKGAHPKLDGKGLPRMSRQEIEADLAGSLRGLGTDYIDLYFLHRDDEGRPVEEILAVLETARQQGRIRYYGCSNWSLRRIREAERAAKAGGYPGFVCNQLMWSLAEIDFDGVGDKSLQAMDGETYADHRAREMNVMAFTSVARGYFSKLLSGQACPQAQAAPYQTEKNRRIAQWLSTERPAGYSVMDLCLLYFRAQPFPAIPITGFSREEQLKEALSAMEKPMPPSAAALFRMRDAWASKDAKDGMV